MMYWIFVAITVGVSFAWVKIRRQRKSSATGATQA
jgi:hypothetical protein